MVDLIGWVFGFFSAHPSGLLATLLFVFVVSIAGNLIPFFPTPYLVVVIGVVLDESYLESYRSQPSRPLERPPENLSAMLSDTGLDERFVNRRGLTLSENSWAEALSWLESSSQPLH